MKIHTLKAGNHTLTVRLSDHLSGSTLAKAKDDVKTLFGKYRRDLNLTSRGNPVNWERYDRAAEENAKTATEMARLLEALCILSPLKAQKFGIVLEGNGGHTGVTHPSTGFPLYFVHERDAFAYARAVLRDTEFGWEVVQFGKCYDKSEVLA